MSAPCRLFTAVRSLVGAQARAREKDAEWITTLMQHGLLQRSVIFCRAQRELTRYRQSLVEERNRFANRLQKVLEGTNIKLSSVVTDIQGVSAKAMLRTLLNGEEDPKVLTELARRRLRNKRAELVQSLTRKSELW